LRYVGPSVADPHHVDADSYPDPDPTTHFSPLLDSPFHFHVDLDPALNFDADPD
jgi:hypothetical protein